MRGIIGVMGGIVLYLSIAEALETVLVIATADPQPTDIVSYFAARNRAVVLGPKLAYNSLTALLSGYMTARVAGESEMYYGKMAAAVLTVELTWRFLMGENAALTPAWMRAFMVLTTGPAMLVGASLRGRARVAQDADESAAPPQEPA